MRIVYRRPEVAEAKAMAALHVACWGEAYRGMVPDHLLDHVDMAEREAAWRRNLNDGRKFVCGAFAHAQPCGFVLASPNSDPALAPADGQIAALYVLARFHRRGIGRHLLAAAARWWIAQGGQTLGLGVLAGNSGARAFYERMGGRLLR